ncbi:M4 family metallopeptidase [Aliikangiella sp. IMCC44359]|uniref:M4 family metallopeptidase n=1 Tax=Aliikangiella sp. IMCC44359 TaxID=3459125 RepID=UPI00403AF134
MNKISFTLSAITISLFSSAMLQAAERQYLSELNQKLTTVTTNVVMDSSDNVRQMLGFSAEDSLQVFKTYVEANGDTTVRYQQMYKGLPILNDHIILTRDASNHFKHAHGAMVSGIEADLISVSPKISLKDAIKKAKAVDFSENELVSTQLVHYENEQSQLGIRYHEGKVQLVYQVSYVQLADQLSRPITIIDAITGEILERYDNLQTVKIGTGPGGNTITGKYYYGVDFDKLDVTQSGNMCLMENSNVKTIDMNNQTSGGSVYQFVCPESKGREVNGAFSPLNDAHFFGGVIYDMYNDYVNTAPLNFQLKMRVHYGNNYANAFWDGRQMTFGDGGMPLTILDVSTHEVSHGFTEQNSGLEYKNKSGGLNEAFSDMAGEAAEFFLKGTNDWKVGADAIPGGMRHMDDPTKDGKSIDKQSDYTDGMDVHYSSGVFNKAFYNLATAPGWDTKKAFQLYAKANQKYWTASTNWDQAGNGILDIACELGVDVNQVMLSLVSVGINSNPSDATCKIIPTPGGNKLEDEVPVTGLSANKGEEIIYTMFVPYHGSNVKIETYGGTGDADLYVKFGSMPTDTDYDCRPYRNGNGEDCYSNRYNGTYYIRIKAYADFNDVTLVGSYEHSSDPSNEPIDRTEAIGSLPRGQWARFTQVLPTGYSNLNVSISGGSGDADLYVRKGAESTTSSYDCRPYKNGNAESCDFTNPAADTWYIDVRGYSAASNVTLKIKAVPSE